jgi:hypothetical protein
VSIVQQHAARCFALDSTGRPITTGHTALGGALGVGKSYVLRGVALVTAALCAVATPLTWDYERAGGLVEDALAPISLLLDLYGACSDTAGLQAEEAEAEAVVARASSDLADEDVPKSNIVFDRGRLRKEGLRPVLLLDEVNAWYRADKHRKRGQLLAAQLQAFGRSGIGIALVTGSSSCLRDQLFAMNEWTSYPSLNASLFRVAEIVPPRDAAEIQAFVEQAGFTMPDGMTAAELLSLSGGVGRVIDEICLAGAALRLHGKLPPLATFDAEVVLRQLALLMLEPAGGSTTISEPVAQQYPAPRSVGEYEAIMQLQRAGFEPGVVRSAILRYRDGGLLLLRPEGPGGPARLEFLYPYHASLFAGAFTAEFVVSLTRMQIQLHGVEGSLGHELQCVCRPQLSALFPRQSAARRQAARAALHSPLRVSRRRAVLLRPASALR